jgi:uncharacterized membrane protein
MAKYFPQLPESYLGFFFHYYRAEVYRETNWRSRMDITTNWAIVTSGAILSFVFSNERVPHVVILINVVMMFFFLHVEARRFRYYVLLRERTRLIEKKLLAPLFSPVNIEDESEVWLEEISKSLIQPRVSMSRMESFAWRIRRQYAFLFPLLFFAWVAKIFTSPKHVMTLADAILQANVWFIPGPIVFIGFATFVCSLLYIAYYIPLTSHVDDLP